MTAQELGEAYIHLTLTPKQARELLAILKDEVDWGYGLSDDLEALRQELKGKLKGLKIRATPVTEEHSPGNPRGMGEAKEA